MILCTPVKAYVILVLIYYGVSKRNRYPNILSYNIFLKLLPLITSKRYLDCKLLYGIFH